MRRRRPRLALGLAAALALPVAAMADPAAAPPPAGCDAPAARASAYAAGRAQGERWIARAWRAGDRDCARLDALRAEVEEALRRTAPAADARPRLVCRHHGLADGAHRTLAQLDDGCANAR